MREVDVTLDTNSIQNAIDILNGFADELKSHTDEAAKKIADETAEIASQNFSSAEYDGTNDVVVSVERVGDSSYDVVASGMATLFIEFGTGVYNADNHPERGVDGIVGHGAYGDGSGGSPWGWTYHGDPGTHGLIVKKNNSEPMVHTYGNIANASLYNAKKEAEEFGSEIIEEVMGNA